MEALFLQILNMSITASWLILAVILIRFFLGKAPKGLRYILWALVGIRLICPFSLESALSLIPSAEVVSEDSDVIEVHTGVSVVDKMIYQVPSGQVSGNGATDDLDNNTTDDSVVTPPAQNAVEDVATSDKVEEKKEIQNSTDIVARVWLIGIAAMLVYAVVSYARLRHTLKASMQIEDKLWVCDEIQSPFILGLVHPQIYIPSFIEEEHIPYIIAHEKEHLKYHDHWWKPLGFAILALHWFNPLVWVAYVLLCRDIELACDERVIRAMDTEDKKNYSKSLLLCSNVRHVISACPVAFGEIGVKERIKNIVNYKKPAVWAAGIGIIVCIIIAICFMTNPKQDAVGDGTEDTESVGTTEDTENTEDSTEEENTGVQLEDKNWLDAAKLEWFETEFFNDAENGITNMFLTSEYSKPADIDMGHLFYDGAEGRGNGQVSQAEIQLLESYDTEWELDVTKVTSQEMNDVLQKYLGMTLDETNKIGLASLEYLEEYDAYYNIAGDTMMSQYDFGIGWYNEDGTITLQYHDALSSYNPTYQVTLREENGNYYFVSNVMVNEVVMVDAGVSDDELTLMQKVLFNKEAYNNGLYIGDVDGIYWSEYGEESLESVSFYTVDLDRDGVDEVCVEYASGLVLIFHEENDAVYAYQIAWRGFQPLYKDGTFCGSGGAAYANFCGNVSFENYEMTYEYITSIAYDNNNGTVHYYKDGHQYGGEGGGIEITEEEYNQIMSNYAMEEVERYDFTVENILEYVN